MTVEKFINGYDKAKEKQEFVKKHIITDYINYETKISSCSNIVSNSMYTNTEPKLFRANTPLQSMLFALTLIRQYTDIELNDDNLLAEYNLLNKNNLVDVLYTSIPEKEITEYRVILDMTVNDLFDNERSIVGFLDEKLSVLNTLINSIPMEEVLNSIKKE